MGPLSRLKQFLRHPFRGTAEPVEPDRPWWDHDDLPLPSPSRDTPVVQHVVDNRVFLLGLDQLYRTAMKRHEGTELLGCAQQVATVLHQEPAAVPVEGYYSEDSVLTTYFRLMRALQAVSLKRAPEVEGMPAFQRLLAVTSSPIFGLPVRENLLPVGRDPLSAALRAVGMTRWTVPLLTTEASKHARATDDYSLVGLAARAEDAVVLAALRESVVLYAESVFGMTRARPRLEYVWNVETALAAAARRFVDGFNGLFGCELPPPTAKYARIFWDACSPGDIVGRCARLGQTDPPVHYYHWAVRRDPGDQLSVHDFWHDAIVTTEQYRRGDWRDRVSARRMEE